jgi:hypothetical protein
MTDPERIEWRRSFPAHALGVLGWYALAAAVGLGVVWVLFGSEPQRLGSGRLNPLAVVPIWAAILSAILGLPFVLSVLRRPIVAANHYALNVRPGWVRTLVLPWARVSEVAAYRVDNEPLLLVRCRDAMEPLGDHPGWLDRTVLRAALREGGPRSRVLSGFDVAVRMSDFVGSPRGQLAALAAFAPDHVVVVSDVEVH